MSWPARSQVNFDDLARRGDAAPDLRAQIAGANTAQEVLSIAGPEIAQDIAASARNTAQALLRGAPVALDTMIVSRTGEVVAVAGP